MQRGTVGVSARRRGPPLNKEGIVVKGFGEKVLQVLVEHRNQTVTLAQLTKATGLNEHQVQHTVSNLRNSKRDLYIIEIVLRGRAWILRDQPEVKVVDLNKRVFEEIGPAKDGSVVIQDSDGKLYKAIEL